MRNRILAPIELQRVLEAAQGLPEPHSSVLQLCLFTGQRLNEVAGITTSELDLNRDIWTLPAARNKARRIHRVPLSPAARKLVAAAAEGKGRDAPVFGQINSGTLKRRLRRALERRLQRADPACLPGAMESFHVHDLRRTCANWLVSNDVPFGVVEQALNHESMRGMKTFSVDNRLDAVRTALTKWADWLTGLTEGPNAWPGGREPAAG
jgi:integrase